MVYLTIYAIPLYATSDLRLIRYTTHPTMRTALGFTAAIFDMWPQCPASLAPYPVIAAKINSWRRSDIAVGWKVSRSEIL